jgi:hypothetical protein
MVDDAYLNGYARHLGPIVSMVYISLCRHVSFQDQLAFPSQELIAQEIGAKKRSIVNAIASLKKWNMIEVERDRSANHGWSRNNYYLLDKSVWKEIPSAFNAHPRPSAKYYIDQVHVVHTKDTHTIKDTHILSIQKKYSCLKDIGEPEFQQIADKYGDGSPNFINFVRSKYDDMVNWAESTGKKKKNWLATLRNFVKSDALKLRKEQKGGKPNIVFINPR